MKTNVEISFYPSPISTGQILQWTSAVDFNSFVLYNSEGKCVHQRELTQNQITIPFLIPGVYTVQLGDGSQFVTKQLLIK